MKNNLITIENILKILAIFLLIYATSWHQYSYYIFLRWFIFLTSIYFSYSSHKNKNKTWLIGFIVISLLFNPIIPIYLSKDVWAIIDVATAILILISIFSDFNYKDKNQ